MEAPSTNSPEMGSWYSLERRPSFRTTALRAVACALEMQKAMEGLNRGNLQLGLPELQMGIGISSGQLIVGNIGSEKRKKYGAVGSTRSNLAFRIQSEAKDGEVLVSLLRRFTPRNDRPRHGRG